MSKSTWHHGRNDHTDSHHVIADHKGETVALTVGTFKQREKRAYQISATPDALAVCEAVVNLWPTMSVATQCQMEPVIQAARKAVAKAKGGAS